MEITNDMALESIITLNVKRYVMYAKKNIEDCKFKSTQEIENEYYTTINDVAEYINNLPDNIHFNIETLLYRFRHGLAHKFLSEDFYPYTLNIIGEKIKEERYPGYACEASFIIDRNGKILSSIDISSLIKITNNKALIVSDEPYVRMFNGSHLFTAQIFLQQMGLTEKDWEINKQIKKIKDWQKLREDFLESVLASLYASNLDNNEELNENLPSQLSNIYNMDRYDLYRIYTIATNYTKQLKR